MVKETIVKKLSRKKFQEKTETEQEKEEEKEFLEKYKRQSLSERVRDVT